MKDEDVAARQMFFDYACNGFYMWHDGVEEEYKRYGISEAQEKEWRREYIALWVSRLEADDLTPINRLSDAWASEALPALIEMADKGDSYARLWYANALWRLATGSNCDPALRLKAKKTATDLWQALQTERIELTESHRAHIASCLPAIGASTPEEYVFNYAAQHLKSAQKQK